MPPIRTIYTAESQVKHPATVLREMVRGVLGGRYAGYRLFMKDLKSEYSKSMFGLLWDFVDPLILATIFYLLMRANVFRSGEIRMPYSMFIIYGVLCYQTFMESVIMPLDLIGRSKVMLTHLKLSPESLLISVFYRICFNSIFRLTIILLFTLLASDLFMPARATEAPPGAAPVQEAASPGEQPMPEESAIAQNDAASTPSPSPAPQMGALATRNAVEAGGAAAEAPRLAFTILGFAKFLLCYPIMIFSGMAIGVFLAPFHVLYNDVGRVTRIILTPLRYVSPVLYALPATPLFLLIDRVNPLASFLNNLRSLAAENYFVDPLGMVAFTGIFAGLSLVGWFIFHVSIPVLADRA